MTDNYLKTWIDRAERLEEEHKAVGTDKRELLSEAKNKGYNPKALRVLLKERKQDAAERELLEADVDLYRTQIGMAVELVRDGLSLRKAARATGTTKSSIHRALAVPTPSHDPATGEITETAGVVPQPGDGAQDGGHTLAAQPAAVADSPEPPMTVPELAAATIALARTDPKQAAAVVAVLGALTEPDLDMPPFLRRERVVA